MPNLQLAVFHSTQTINGVEYLPDSYVIERLNAGELLQNDFDGDISIAPFQPIQFCENVDWNHKKFLIVRNGGFGDLLFLTPAIHELKKRWPDIVIVVCSLAKFHPILQGNPDVDQLINYPPTMAQFQQCDAHFWAEGAIDRGPLSKTTHSVDIIAQMMGLTGDFDKSLIYVPDPRELEAAWEAAPRSNRPRVAIQAQASDACRTWPFLNFQELLIALLKKDYEVFILGAPNDARTKHHENLYNFTQRDPQPGIRESIAFMTTCDAIFAPDSVMAHVGGSLDIPTVALYGPFPADLRVRYAKSIVPLEGKCPISPCFHQPGPKEPYAFPTNGPCDSEGICCALRDVTPTMVIETIEKIMKPVVLK